MGGKSTEFLLLLLFPKPTSLAIHRGIDAFFHEMYNDVHTLVQTGGEVKTASFSEFRRNAADFLDQVEKGEVVRIMRHGRPVADLTPVSGDVKPSWKKAPPQIVLKGVSLAKAILDDRRASDR